MNVPYCHNAYQSHECMTGLSIVRSDPANNNVTSSRHDDQRYPNPPLPRTIPTAPTRRAHVIRFLVRRARMPTPKCPKCHHPSALNEALMSIFSKMRHFKTLQ